MSFNAALSIYEHTNCKLLCSWEMRAVEFFFSRLLKFSRTVKILFFQRDILKEIEFNFLCFVGRYEWGYAITKFTQGL